MAYDFELSERLARFLEGRKGFILKKMFGGIGWLLNGNMCVGIYKEWLIIRVGEGTANDLLKEEYMIPMNLTKRVMKGWVMIEPEGIIEDKDLEKYIDYAVKFVSKIPPK